MFLPLELTVLYILHAQLVHSQQTAPQLTLNSLHTFNASSLPKVPSFALPSSSSELSVSVALCSAEATPPRFFVTNDSSISDPSADDLGNVDVFEISLDDGSGSWTGAVPNGGYFAVSNAGQTPFEVGVSDGGPMHQLLDNLPLLGDTTLNEVLVFSPPFSPSPPVDPPTYPNYTLPAANTSFPVGPTTPPNVTLYVSPTSASSLVTMPRTGCAMRASNVAGSFNLGANKSEGIWLRDASEGWRWQWLVGGLTPLTNYTVYAIVDETKVSEPINFVTKSASFVCPIVHSLPYCPTVNYAVPIAPPPFPFTAHATNTLPNTVVDPLLQVLTNFTVSLTTFACGRDQYSPLVSCADCQQAYRNWLCAVWFPRCSEAAPESGSDSQKPMSALQAQAPSATPRSPGLSPISSSYDVLLPCLETCTAADRACPNFLGFKCPITRFNAADSYGVGYVDSGADGVQGGGIAGTAQDRYGNVWCNQT